MAMNDFQKEVAARIESNRTNDVIQSGARAFMLASVASRYSYNFSWLGRPIIQYPQDILAMQELIWTLKPDLIIETGIAHGGSVIFSASILELNAACGGPPTAEVIGIDIDIRAHNRIAIETHPMAKRIHLIEGSSTAKDVVDATRTRAAGKSNVLVCLDSNHTHEHVLAELQSYAPLTTVGSYCVVFDTIIEEMPPSMYPDRPWGPGNNPKSAIVEYLRTNHNFEADETIDDKLLITVARGGYLRRVR